MINYKHMYAKYKIKKRTVKKQDFNKNYNTKTAIGTISGGTNPKNIFFGFLQSKVVSRIF